MAAQQYVVMGISGCGKTTVVNALAEKLQAIPLDGDDYHPQSNVDKMASGNPLNDEDRFPWLTRLSKILAEHSDRDETAVIACSALKRSYRDILRGEGVPVFFIHLDPDKDTVAKRLATRSGHFMPASLLDSQIDTLQRLEPDEAGTVVTNLDAPDEVIADIITRLPNR